MDYGVSAGQFVDVSRVSSSDNGGDGHSSAHHSLQDVQISLIKPLGGKYFFDECRLNVIRKLWKQAPVHTLLPYLGRSGGASPVRPPSEDQHRRRREPGLDGKRPVDQEGKPPL